jgi:hypothetical protein
MYRVQDTASVRFFFESVAAVLLPTERVPTSEVVNPSVATVSVAEMEVPSVVSAVIVVDPSAFVTAVPVATDKVGDVEEVRLEVADGLFEVTVLRVSLIVAKDPSVVVDGTSVLLVNEEEPVEVVNVEELEEVVHGEELVEVVNDEEDVEELQVLTKAISAKPTIGLILDSPCEQLMMITNGIPVAVVGVYVAVINSQELETPAATPAPAAPTVTESIWSSNSHWAVTESLDSDQASCASYCSPMVMEAMFCRTIT